MVSSSPLGLMISPQSWATVKRLAHTRPLGRVARELPDQRVLGIALVRRHVLAREALREEVVGHYVALGIEPGSAAIDAGRTLGIPARRLVAHVLNPNRLAG